MATFFIQQFGCRATQADGAALERQLLDRGCIPAANVGAADVVVVNTCTVTASADAQTRDALRKLHAQNPSARLIVTGCYAQRAPEELAALPGVSYVVGNSHKPQIPDLVLSNSSVGAGLAPPAFGPGRPASSVREQYVAPHFGNQLSDPVSSGFSTFVSAASLTPDSDLPFHSLLESPNSVGAGLAPPSSSNFAPILIGDIFASTELLSAPLVGDEAGHTRPTLKIQDGCNLRCSYCVIPYVRGKSRSLPPDAVIREIQALTAPASAHQAREIVLSGINLGTYGRDLTLRTNLLALLRRILDETSLDRLRLSSIEPQDVTQDLVALFASTDRLAQHFHMPLQSGSDRVLAAMHRRYRIAHYARRLELIHECLPHAAIGADVIAGFPGESDADHAASCAFIEQHPFTYLHVFSFSARPGTPAAALPGQVPPHVIKARARQLRALSETKSAAFRRGQLGRTLRVLTLRRDERDEREGVTPALSSNYLNVSVAGLHPANLWLDLEFGDSPGDPNPMLRPKVTQEPIVTR
jgi:threonylcarbamoyladenosine tRNA methylthiotransferase MtaB